MMSCEKKGVVPPWSNAGREGYEEQLELRTLAYGRMLREEQERTFHGNPQLVGGGDGKFPYVIPGERLCYSAKETNALRIADHYVRTGLALGVTVQEWEESRGLARYSVYPDARRAHDETEDGFFMYPNRDVNPHPSHEREEEESMMDREEKCRVDALVARRQESARKGMATKKANKAKKAAAEKARRGEDSMRIVWSPSTLPGCFGWPCIRAEQDGHVARVWQASPHTARGAWCYSVDGGAVSIVRVRGNRGTAKTAARAALRRSAR